uniref:Uncharacterized protein n=1 Tax=Salix viminalis TaxID=40686 RepID=A0A6N2KHU4_SALVM
MVAYQDHKLWVVVVHKEKCYPCRSSLQKWQTVQLSQFGEASNLGGKGPERLFPDRSKNSREDIFPIHPGICPCKLLFESILPVKKLLDRSNRYSELMLPNEEGMLPVKLLFERSSITIIQVQKEMPPDMQC